MKEIDTRVSKTIVAMLYAFIVSIAFNLFWLPGNIYASGITGFSQLLVSIVKEFFQVNLSIPLIVLLINVPLLLMSIKLIDREFTFFTTTAVLSTYVFMNLIPVTKVVDDPIISAIVGGALHGLSVGITLDSNFSTGGLDILGIIIRKKTTMSLGTIFIIFNLMIQFTAGFFYGWEYAFYSALGVFISGHVVDEVNRRQQKMQVMIVTGHSEALIATVQKELSRGITVVNNVEGAFLKEEKKILFIIVSKKELRNLESLVCRLDRSAFISVSPGVSTNTQFYEW